MARSWLRLTMRGRRRPKCSSRARLGPWYGRGWIMTLSSDSIPSRPGYDGTGIPVGAARAALFWERIWSRLWPASGIAGLLIAAALAGLFEPLPWILHAFAIALAATFIGLALERAFRDFRLPGWDDAARRIEQRSGL